jgi:hypothetical protein
MDLDVGDTIRCHARERFQETLPVLFFGIEESITGRAASRILKLCGDGGPTGGPSSNPLRAGALVGTLPERLKVVGKE